MSTIFYNVSLPESSNARLSSVKVRPAGTFILGERVDTGSLAKCHCAALMRMLGLFAITALAELLGCYLPLLWLTGRGSIWLLVPAAASLVAFVWLLTLHPMASGRVYATYGAVYIAMALLWLYLVDGVKPAWNDYLGAGLALAGAAVIAFGHTGR